MFTINHHTRKYVSSFLAGIYVLLMLFATNLHDHHHPSFKNVDSQKFEKQYTINTDDVSTLDCWSCHFLGSTHSLVPQEFNFEVLKLKVKNTAVATFQDFVSVDSFSAIYLRGPPSFQ